MSPASADEPFRLLTFTTVYPNAARPSHGVFVENRLRHLVASGAATATVIAPVPYYPRWLPGPAEWRRHARAPRAETRHRLRIQHPRYLAVPKLGSRFAVPALADAGLREVRRLLAQGHRFDVIDAHFVYPDGAAAVRIGRALGLPVVITARGTDINLMPRYPGPRQVIERTLRQADALIAVSAALKAEMLALGAPEETVTVLRNGVDLTTFRPVDRGAARAAFGITRPAIVSVGYLIERKGHHRTIEALAALPDTELLIAGEGPEQAALLSLAARLGVANRVRLLGALPHDQLAPLYAAADLMVLASSREGWANVLLESMACGTPVVASPIWGNPEVVAAPEAGRIATENTAEALADAIRALLAAPPDRAATRAYAERFGWHATTEGQIALFSGLMATPRPNSPRPSTPGFDQALTVW